MPIPQSNHIIGEPFTELLSVGSTNNYAMGMAQNGAATHGSTWFAHSQTAGKGQRGKTWKSEPGENIAQTVLLDTSWLPVSSQFHLSIAVALAVYDMFSSYAGDETSIKWPNDIYWRDRKAVGILIENSIKGNIWQWAVAGTGVNINQVAFPPEVQNAVSLRQITGKRFDSVVLGKELCAHLQKRYLQLAEKGVDDLLIAYNQVLFKKGERVKLKKENIAFECVIDHVDEQGRLWVKEAADEYFTFGQVQWVLK